MNYCSFGIGPKHLCFTKAIPSAFHETNAKLRTRAPIILVEIYETPETLSSIKQKWERETGTLAFTDFRKSAMILRDKLVQKVSDLTFGEIRQHSDIKYLIRVLQHGKSCGNRQKPFQEERKWCGISNSD
ncbi:hypothetical protein AVEN_250668-1 [Araneus ventricosus]|uniref:Uncharacterized protein n=1 Tax=Araneus ventricosus TaxID=182803 RepID=A0A4Y2JU80_ARAVE|nr:hypothetical protein AVEN_250668-1 [Araneus ventricosus]